MTRMMRVLTSTRRRRRLWQKHQSILYALHPDRLPAESIRLTYTFGLGGISILAATLTILTGLFLTLYYQPTPEGAHASIVLIEDVVAFGSLIRALHYWAAQLFVLAVTLHMARIVFTGAYARPRRLNWLIGLGLLVLVLLWDFSGYVLRWDEGAHWALLVGTNLVGRIPHLGRSLYLVLMGDRQIGEAALLRFYGWHVIGLTLPVVFGIVYHLFRLRVDGGISRPPRPAGRPRRMVSKDVLFQRETIAALLITGGLLLLSALRPAPLGASASLDRPPPTAQAPWIFLWVQRLLRHLPPFWAGVGIPLALLTLLAAIPWLDPHARAGRWFDRRRGPVQALFAFIALLLIVLTVGEVIP